MSKKSLPKKKYNKFAQKGLSSDQRKLMRNFFSYEPIWDIEDVNQQLSSLLKEKREKLKELKGNEEPETYRYSSNSEDEKSLKIAERGLTLLGFQKITDTLTSRINRHSREKRQDVFQTWVHPRGVFLTLNSYGEPGIDGDYRLNSIRCETQLDVGSGFSLAFVMARRGHYSSSNFTSLPQGRGVSHQSFSDDDIFGLLRYLEARQASGVLMPFNEWALSASHIFISPELFLNDINGLCDTNSPQSFGEQILPHYLEAFEHFKENTLPHCPEGLVDIFNEGMALNLEYSEEFKGCSKPTLPRAKEFDWRSCEEGLNYYDKLATYSLNRYESEHDRKFVQAWHEGLVARSDQHLTLEDKSHQTENGYSWLLCCAARLGYQPKDEGNILPLFLKGVEEMDFLSLRNLCETPDPTGMTLLVHFFNVASENSSMTQPDHRPITIFCKDIIQSIAQRYNNENVALPEVGNEKATIHGVWLKNVVGTGRPSYYSPAPYDLLTKWKSEFEKNGFPVREEWNIVLPYEYVEKDHRAFVTPLQEVRADNIGDLFDVLTKGMNDDQKVRNNFIFKAILEDVLKDTLKEKSPTTRRM